MEDECSSLSWEFYSQQEGLEDLSHSLLYTTLELEATIVSAREEIARRECELLKINDVLSRVIKERDEAQEMCKKLVLEKQELLQKLKQNGIFSKKQNSETVSSSSDSDETNIASSPSGSSKADASEVLLKAAFEQAEKKALPEKGKLLQAVVEAGPLLHTLLLAGPLPQWQHPPPQLHSIEIPPIVISSPTAQIFNHKRNLDLPPFESPSSSKLRKIIRHS